MIRCIAQIVRIDPDIPDGRAIVRTVASYFSHTHRVNEEKAYAIDMGRYSLESFDTDIEDLVVKMTDDRGFGLFAGRDFAEGDCIIYVRGTLILRSRQQTPYERAYTWDGPGDYCMACDSPTFFNVSKFINSCRNTVHLANVAVVWDCNGKVPFVMATRAIQSGDELLANYYYSS